MEIKEIEGAPGYYITRTGKVLREKNIQVDWKGYSRVHIKSSNYRLHRLLAIAFIPRVEGKEEINHKDRDKTNNNLSNLEWCTSSENTIHSYKNQLQKNDKYEVEK